MYQGKQKVFNPTRLEEDRANLIGHRSGAIFNSFLELEDILNKSELARQYFGRSHSWLSQRLNGSMVNNAKKEFSAPEAHKLADAFRDIAQRLTSLAAEIDAVADTD